MWAAGVFATMGVILLFFMWCDRDTMQGFSWAVLALFFFIMAMIASTV